MIRITSLVRTAISFIGVSFLAVSLVLLASVAAPAQAATTPGSVEWLCHPGLASDPCETPLDTTTVDPDGSTTVSTPARKPSAQRPIDCFYVYPTVSNQLTPNATKSADPEITSIARFQAAGFSTECRSYAPLYRQFPLAGIPLALVLGNLPLSPVRTAYSDVLAAWKDYLAKDNHGRGFVLISHSQGSLMVRKLIHDTIDQDPALRKRLVGAVILGGNVLTAKGSDVGGDFANIPTCTRRGQDGCVVAYSTYASNPLVPFFGSANFDFLSRLVGLPTGQRYQVACTDPATLSGITGPVGVTIPTKPFAFGPISLGIQFSVLFKVPTAPTTWVTSKDRYVGSCRTINGATVYRYDPTPGSQRPLEFPPTWGTHLFDMNLGLNRLVSIVHQQAATWLAHH